LNSVLNKILREKIQEIQEFYYTQTGYLNALDCLGKSFYTKASWDTHVLQVVWKELPQEYVVIFLAVRLEKISALLEK